MCVRHMTAEQVQPSDKWSVKQDMSLPQYNSGS